MREVARSIRSPPLVPHTRNAIPPQAGERMQPGRRHLRPASPSTPMMKLKRPSLAEGVNPNGEHHL